MPLIENDDTQPDCILAFTSLAYEDAGLNEMLTLAQARLESRLAPGLLLMETPHSPALLAERLAEAPPVFVRQVIVGIRRCERTGAPKADAAAIVNLVPEMIGGTIVLCDSAGRCPPDLTALKAALPVPAATRDDSYLILASRDSLFAGTMLSGAGIRHAPPWPGGRPNLPYLPDLVSRSALKLLEAIELFGIRVEPRAQALDLGAAPGGWSQVLAGSGAAVTAVDPGQLDQRVASLANVHSFAGTAQAYFRHATEPFDLIVDDMRLDARESARLLVEAGAFLRPTGSAIITLKLPERGPTAVLRPALAILANAYEIAAARCLFFNRNEITVYLHRR